MPGERSRQGCEECRRRRRKCDEQKPNCGPCSAFGRPCKYTLKLVWGASKPRRSSIGQWRAHSTTSTEATGPEHGNDGPANASSQQFLSLPQSLPNGVPLPPRYQKLLSYFTEDILASLSCHPAIHEDLCRGLIPVALDSPHLLSACLALSAAGFLSRGLSEVEGIEISRVLGHLQHSGLALLRSALDSRQSNETLLVTCLIWCLADVFACGQGGSSWRIHLQGIKALIDGNRTYQKFGTGSGVSRTSMRHLYLLYLSLQTLPYVPPLDHLGFDGGHGGAVALPPPHETDTPSAAHQSIDGFLGYSEELLHVLQQINAISSTSDAESASCSIPQSDILLGKLAGMIRRDASTPPEISICTSLSTQHGREFLLCHKTFQQATLVHLYRRLYRMPSGSPPIQAAIAEIEDMVSEMTQGRPCHTWVAMAMPLFTLGCEAFAPAQRSFILDKIDKFEACLGSLHVRIIRQALEDIWQARETLGDGDGDLCASQLLDTLQYNIILF